MRLLPAGWSWERRRERAAELASARPEAREVLEFYREVATTQGLLAGRAGPVEGVLEAYRERRGAIPSSLPVGRFWVILHTAARAGPEPIARAAQRLQRLGLEAQSRALASFFGAPAAGTEVAPNGERFASDGRGGEPGADGPGQSSLGTDGVVWLLAHLFVQPYAEVEAAGLARREGRGGAGATKPSTAPEEGGGRAGCPLCGGAVQVGYLVEREGEQGGLYLMCSLCGVSWRSPRLVCPFCGASAEQLSYFRVDELPHVRLDVCEACKFYLKVVDLRTDGRAVPPVDDLASFALDLWAREQGYHKACLSLAGV